MLGDKNLTLPLTVSQASRLARDDWIRSEKISIPAHHIIYAFRLVGPLDQSALVRALKAVVARHESLRASFPAGHQGRIQQISDLAEIEIVSIDSGSAALLSQIAGLAQRPFQPGHPPLLRVILGRMPQNVHIFVLAVEHLIADGWSVKVILEEISVFYARFTGKGPGEQLPPAPSWSAYVLAERERLSGLQLTQDAAVEGEYLELQRALAALPKSDPTLTRRQYLAIVQAEHLGIALTRQLEAVAVECGVSVSCTLLTVLSALIFATSDVEEVTVLMPAWSRQGTGHERLVGWATNMILIHTRRRASWSFRDLAKRIQGNILDGLRKNIPYDELIRRMAVEYYGKFPPQGHVYFSVAPPWKCDLDFPGIYATRIPVEAELWTLGLSFDCGQSDGSLVVNVAADRGLYAVAEIQVLARNFISIAEAMAEDPDSIAVSPDA